MSLDFIGVLTWMTEKQSIFYNFTYLYVNKDSFETRNFQMDGNYPVFTHLCKTSISMYG